MSAVNSGSARRGARQGRGNLWLGVLAVVQAGLVVLVLLTVARPPTTKTGPLLGAGVKTSDITAFTVTGKSGSKVTLKRSGVHWVLPDLGDYPAKASRVTSLLNELTALKRSGLVAITKDAYKRLQVAPTDYQRKVALTLKGGKTETLYIGSEPTYGSTHVRLASGKGVYVTHSLHASDARTDASGYVDPTALKLNAADVTRVEVKNAHGDFVFTKTGKSWSLHGIPTGRTLNAHAVSTMVSSLADLQLNEPLGKKVEPAYGFSKPLAVVTITTVTKQSPSGSGSAKGSPGAGKGSAKAGGSSGAKASTSRASAAATSANVATSTAKASASPKGGAKAAPSQGAAKGSSAAAGSAKPSSTANATANAAPAQTVTKTTTITVGAKDKSGFYAVRLSSSPFIIRASGYSLGDVVSKKEADFLTKPPKKSGSGKASGSTSGSTSGGPSGAGVGGLPGITTGH